eukprot:221273-Alexandrium_andersonii.AAC.1
MTWQKRARVQHHAHGVHLWVCDPTGLHRCDLRWRDLYRWVVYWHARLAKVVAGSGGKPHARHHLKPSLAAEADGWHLSPSWTQRTEE